MIQCNIVEKPKPKPFIPRRKKNSIVDWFMLPQQEVEQRFLSLPNAQLVGKGDESFVFVPGTREDRVVLVAHSDTVFDELPEVVYCNGLYYSNSNKVGIGADDRAGCALLWKLRDLGHSLLIPNAEEKGCRGSKFLSRDKEWKKIINEHRFAIEMDRMNGTDLVFYSVGSKAFEKWCEEQFKGYKEARGSYTDICEICDPMCGLNISVGYYGQHGSSEYLKINEWCRTLSNLRTVLSKPNLPRFEQDPRPVYTPTNYNTGTKQYSGYGGGNFGSYNRPASNYVSKIDSIVVCIACDFIQDASEVVVNDHKCVKCNKEFE